MALRQRCRGYEGNFGLDRLVWTLEIRIEKIAHALFAFFAGRFARLRWAKKQGSRLIQRRLNFGQRGINLEPCLFGQHSGRQSHESICDLQRQKVTRDCEIELLRHGSDTSKTTAAPYQTPHHRRDVQLVLGKDSNGVHP